MKNSKVLLYSGILSKLLLILFVALDYKLMVAGSLASLGTIICMYIISDSRDSLVRDFKEPGFIINNSGSNFAYGKKYFESAPYIESIHKFVVARIQKQVPEVSKAVNTVDTKIDFRLEFFGSVINKLYQLIKKAYDSEIKRHFRNIYYKMTAIKDYINITFSEIHKSNEIYVNIK